MSPTKAEIEGVPAVGDVIAGKFVVERIIGCGGMGVVVAVRHTQLNQNAAIKFLLPSAAKHGDAMARFLREARAAASIRSEHVARVTDVGTLESGAPYMLMEYLTGTDLGAVVRNGPLLVQVAVDYVLQASEAIAEAHSLGIIHRDLKPANLFLTSRPDGSPLVKVIDFGISKMHILGDAGGHELTTTSAVMGSPLYMSPEQAKSTKSADARSDIWALGVILYELLGGRSPFDGESLAAIIAKILTEPAPPLSAIRPDVPAELAAFIARCLEKDPARRPADMAAFAQALGPFAGRSSSLSIDRIVRLSSPPIGSESTVDVMGVRCDSSAHASIPVPAPGPGAMAPPPGVTDASWGATYRPPRGRRGALIAGGGVLAVAAIALAVIGRSSDVPAPEGARSAASVAGVGVPLAASSAPAIAASAPSSVASAGALPTATASASAAAGKPAVKAGKGGQKVGPPPAPSPEPVAPVVAPPVRPRDPAADPD